MKTIILVFFSFRTLGPPNYAQTQLLRVGNATGFGDYLYGPFSADITVDEVTINGMQYFKRKLEWSHPLSEYRVSYERIEGDSAYYVFSSTNTDSLVFNFNWPVGTIANSFISGGDIWEYRIDSVKFSTVLIPQDTLYYIGLYWIDITTGDTTFGNPPYKIYSKKLGRTDYGIFINLQGAKIDGVRYGDIIPYPEEIVFSENSLYSEFIGDTVNCFLKNTSEYDVVLDSIYTSGIFPYGYLMYLIKDNNYFFINLFNNYPSHPLDTLNYIIPAHDSILLQIYDIDLCAICNKQPNEYFEDNLRFVFSFVDGVSYSFSNSIQISGEGHPSDVVDNEVMPNEFVLHQNYPNPFNPSTKISWQSPVGSWQTLKIFDVLGNEVATLVSEYRDAGRYEIEFNAEKLSSGVYYYQLRAGDYVETKKMIYLK